MDHAVLQDEGIDCESYFEYVKTTVPVQLVMVCEVADRLQTWEVALEVVQ